MFTSFGNKRTLSIGKALRFFGVLFLSLGNTLPAQNFSTADSGWVPLFNGLNFDGLYSRMYTQEMTAYPNKTFSIVGGTIRVTQGNGWEQGHIGTVKKYSHYRARVEYKFDDTEGNAGMTYHGDESPPRMHGNLPRSIESQMMQGNAGRAYSIAMCTFATRATGGNFDSLGQRVEVCEKTPCNARDYGASEIRDNRGQWNSMEIIVRGSDSATHKINGKAVMKVWNIRAPTTGEDYATLALHGTGFLALQAEGANITYKNWEIMELPDAGPDRLQRFFLTSPNQGTNLISGTQSQITWKTIGTVKKVSLFFKLSESREWVMAADNINNTGTFSWTVPNEVSKNVRFVVSAAPWVTADTSDGDNAIIAATGLQVRGQRQSKQEKGRQMKIKMDKNGKAKKAHDLNGRRTIRNLP